LRVKIALTLVLALAGQSVQAQSEDGFAGVARILRTNCVACHNAADAQGQLILTKDVAYDNLVNREATGAKAKLVVPGDPERSYLLTKLLRTPEAAARRTGGPMPPAGTLGDEQLAQIRQWILDGAKP
jgi:mono/diheme cytochrome c family protein